MLLVDLSLDVDATIVGLHRPEECVRGRGRRRRRGRRMAAPDRGSFRRGNRRRRRGRRARVLEDLRLKEMGLRPGERIRVIQKAGIGGRVIALGCARIAVDSATAKAIEVEVAG